MMPTKTKYMTATDVYDTYRLPRSLLRQLAQDGVIEQIEKTIGSNRVLKLYRRKDVDEYMNAKD